jgi:hypothetical protein
MNTTSKLPRSATLLWALVLIALLACEAQVQSPVPSVTLSVPSWGRIGDSFTISATFDNAYTDTTGADGFYSDTTPPPTLPATTPLSGQERHCSGADAC